MIRTICLSLAAVAVLSASGAGAQPAKPVAMPAVAPAAPAASTPQPPVAYPQALILIRSALTAVEQADEAGDYSVLYAIGAKGFQQANPPAKLAQTFGPLRAYNLNSILVLEPHFTEQPVLTADGMMRMSGYFISGPYHINFQLIYAAENKHWKLFGVSAGVQP